MDEVFGSVFFLWNISEVVSFIYFSAFPVDHLYDQCQLGSLKNGIRETLFYYILLFQNGNISWKDAVADG